MNAVTLNYAKQNLDQIVEQVISDAEPTIICTDSNQRIVMLSLEEFHSWQETRYLLSNAANAEHLRESILEAKMGQTQERELIEV